MAWDCFSTRIIGGCLRHDRSWERKTHAQQHNMLAVLSNNKKPQLSLTNRRDVMFARYSPSNYRVTLKLGGGPGHSRSSKVPPFGSSGMTSYSISIATMAVSRTVSGIHRLIGQKSPIFTPSLYSAPQLGVKPLELSIEPR